jgi:peptide-methionine (R)-S-oxide reductase
MDDARIKKDAELSPELYRVAREQGTEAPFTGQYWNSHEPGMYRCAVCGVELFSADAKFDSGTGWPSFDQALPGAVRYVEDRSLGASRTEVVCAKCGAHLGHVFDDGPKETTGKRYCMNSVCLRLEKAGENKKPAA